VEPYDGIRGNFKIRRSNKKGRDFRAKGRLQYVGEHFLKAGPDAPETLLDYQDFDGTQPGRKRAERSGEAAPTQSLKTWGPHVGDWREGDPTWQDGKGKGLIGALNYIASKGVNSFSFLPYNSGGDGDNVWPFVERMDKLHYDVSKLAQWEVVFDHGTNKGLHLHFKLQENEIDDNCRGHEKDEGTVPESFDGGTLGVERKLYCRELIARFAHHLALNWNIGEENTQSIEEINCHKMILSVKTGEVVTVRGITAASLWTFSKPRKFLSGKCTTKSPWLEIRTTPAGNIVSPGMENSIWCTCHQVEPRIFISKMQKDALKCAGSIPAREENCFLDPCPGRVVEGRFLLGIPRQIQIRIGWLSSGSDGTLSKDHHS